MHEAAPLAGDRAWGWGWQTLNGTLKANPEGDPSGNPEGKALRKPLGTLNEMSKGKPQGKP